VTGHPSVSSNHISAAAIGILAVVKTKDGVQLSFAHNTDSFVSSRSLLLPSSWPMLTVDKAMASQNGDESRPQASISRSSKSGEVALGGRVFRARKRRAA